MDYFEIVLKGFFNEKDNLVNYFVDEFEQAGRSLFFEGCLKIIERFESELQEKVRVKKDILISAITDSINGTIEFDEKANVGSKEDIIKCAIIEAATLNESNFHVDLHPVKYGFYPYNMSYQEVLFLKNALLKAKELKSINNAQIKDVKNNPKNKIKENINFSHKQIAIAYHVMGIQITPKNAHEILKKYPNIKSVATLLRKRVYRTSDLTKISQNKSTDTKHLDDLKAAKRLVSGKNIKKAETDINRIITAFETAYEKQYQK
jgi:hypothetical protein